MSKKLAIALAQMNAHVGHVSDNLRKFIQFCERADALGADVIVSPEMFLSGYPCDDLVLRSDFMQSVEDAIEALLAHSANGGPAMIVGAPRREDGQLYNSAFIIDNGAILAIRDKVQLPNYGVFDDKRHFSQGALKGPVLVRDTKIGIAICEDIWWPDVCETQSESGAEIIVSLNASPYDIDKPDSRMMHAVARLTETSLPFIYVNMVGGQDELVFDGGSFALNLKGKLAARLPQMTENLSLVHCKTGLDDSYQLTGQIAPPEEELSDIYRALMLGIRDYVTKNGFPGVALGLSGGIDSALVAILAVDALGADQVRCLMMPSGYTADISKEDADDMAARLGVPIDTVPIGPGMQAVEDMMAGLFAGTSADVTEENIQSRLRGMLLMALSNKFGNMILTTGNKSEYAAGYATLYGDMCGGYAPLKDIWKMQVFALTRWRNEVMPKGALGPEGEVIPPRIITRPPSAELRPDQQDTDSLPPYEVLDDILRRLTEDMSDIDSIVKEGYDRALVMRISHLLFRAEYKRFQSAPGPKITSRAFGRDRRLPLTSGFLPHHISPKESSS
ncbi:MAG: NAD+ synthase [Candidatus Puniceispirillaceae bacterium]